MSENKPLIISLAVVGLLVIGYMGYLFMTSEPEKPVVTQPLAIPDVKPEPVVEEPIVETPVVPEPEVIESFEPIPEPEPPKPTFVLPLLDDSDQLLRDGAVSLTRHEGIHAWLAPNELVRKIVVFVDNVANGSIARQPVSVLAPRGSFSATPVSEELYVLDDATYNRYNQVTTVLVSLDTRRAVEFYVLLRPLFQEAYDELGYPNAKFDDAIFKAIGRLLETPVMTEPVRLVRPVVMYEFEDERLEALSSVQKQMIRMGPTNTRAIQEKLSQVALELRSVLEQ